MAKMAAELAREHAPEIAFSPPLQIGETTIICAATVSCLAAGRGPNLLVNLRSVPCAVIVVRPGQCSVLPLGSPHLADRLLDLAPRLLDLLAPPPENQPSPGASAGPAPPGTPDG